MAIWRESTSSTARSKTASLSLVLKSTWRLLSVLVTDVLVVNSMAPSLVNVALARHTYPARTSTHVVASGHGLLSHQTLSSQNFPVKFAGQLQWKSFQVTMHWPPF